MGNTLATTLTAKAGLARSKVLPVVRERAENWARAVTLLVLREPFAYASAGVSAVVYMAICLFRNARYGSGMDLGLFDETIRGYSHFQIVPNTIQNLPNLLAEHFHPLLMVLAPLYWVWNDARVLLVAQAMLVAVASLPIYYYGKERLGRLTALKLQVLFLVFWGIAAGTLYDFHEVALGVPLVSLALWATLKRRNRWLWVAIALGVLVKENMALIFAALGLYILVGQRRWKLGAAVIGVSGAAFLVIMKLMSSGAFGAAYKFWTYTKLGPDPVSAAKHLLLHPKGSLKIILENPVIVGTLKALFVPWLLLPLVSPLFIVAAPTLLERFLSDRPSYWPAQFHYSMTIAPILAFATIDTLARLERRWPKVRRMVAESVTVMLALNMIWLVPLSNPAVFGRVLTRQQTQRYDACLRLIPAGASVLASNYLVSHLSNRRDIYVIRDNNIRGQYIALDLGGTPEISNDADLAKIVEEAEAKSYRVACSTDSLAILTTQRVTGHANLSSTVANLTQAYPQD
jgi:uncharacterized membrane protein